LHGGYGNATHSSPAPSRGLRPKLIELTDDVLFGDVWERPGLSPRDRSLVTVTALAAVETTD
jgi:4-carboxymuconolactone decarboxylase